MTLNYGGLFSYSITNPDITEIGGQLMDGLEGFTVTGSSVTGSDSIKHILKVGNDLKWYDGTGWTTSAGTFAEANTAAEIHNNRAALDLSTGVIVRVRSLLNSADGTTTPFLTQITVCYNFFSTAPTAQLLGALDLR